MGLVATVTQNVPYLGAVSSSLTHIQALCDVSLRCCDPRDSVVALKARSLWQEVTIFKGEWNAVKRISNDLQEIVNATREQCDDPATGSSSVPSILVEPLKKLETCVHAFHNCSSGECIHFRSCVAHTRVVLDECGCVTETQTQRPGFHKWTSQGKRLVRIAVNRKTLLDAVTQCRNDLDTTLSLFNVS